jgi:hypothetical protein
MPPRLRHLSQPLPESKGNSLVGRGLFQLCYDFHAIDDLHEATRTGNPRHQPGPFRRFVDAVIGRKERVSCAEDQIPVGSTCSNGLEVPTNNYLT